MIDTLNPLLCFIYLYYFLAIPFCAQASELVDRVPTRRGPEAALLLPLCLICYSSATRLVLVDSSSDTSAARLAATFNKRAPPASFTLEQLPAARVPLLQRSTLGFPDLRLAAMSDSKLFTRGKLTECAASHYIGLERVHRELTCRRVWTGFGLSCKPTRRTRTSISASRCSSEWYVALRAAL